MTFEVNGHNIFLIVSICFLSSLIFVEMMRRVAIFLKVLDVPNEKRKIQKEPVPLLGGIGIFLAFLLGYMLFAPKNDLMLSILISAFLIMLLGLFDDMTKCETPMPNKYKVIVQVVVACIVVFYGGLELEKASIFGTVIHFGIFSKPLSIIIIVATINAINLIDGLDGLSSGIALISCVSLLIIFALNSSPIIAVLMITSMIGALVGFLPFNFSPAKTFIGDTGSNFLGYILSVVSILGVAKTYTAVVIALPMLVLGFPILDVTCAIIRRLIKGKSIKAIFKADKGHLHHKLVARGFSQKQSVLILYAVSAAFGIFAIIIFESGIWKALSFLLMVVAALFLGYRNFVDEQTEKDEKYECGVCKYIYNPKTGNEKAGIKPGTQFEDLPENWVCPVCGEAKDVFEIHR